MNKFFERIINVILFPVPQWINVDTYEFLLNIDRKDLRKHKLLSEKDIKRIEEERTYAESRNRSISPYMIFRMNQFTRSFKKLINAEEKKGKLLYSQGYFYRKLNNGDVQKFKMTRSS